MLETIREFAQEQLAANGEEAFVRRQHAQHYLARLEATGGWMLVRAGERVCHAADQENIQAALRWLLTYRLAEVADVRADLPHEGRYVRVRPVLDQLPVGHAMHCNPRDRDDLAGRLVAQTFPNPRGARRHPSHHLVTLGDQVVDGMHRVEER